MARVHAPDNQDADFEAWLSNCRVDKTGCRSGRLKLEAAVREASSKRTLAGLTGRCGVRTRSGEDKYRPGID